MGKFTAIGWSAFAVCVSVASLDGEWEQELFLLTPRLAGLMGGLRPPTPTFFSFLDERKEDKRKSRR